MSYKRLQRYREELAVLAYANGNICGKHIALEATQLPPDEFGEKLIRSGTFVAKDLNDVYRWLPRTNVGTAALNGVDTVIEIDTPEVFYVGDELFLSHPESVLTLTSAAVSETLTLDVGAASFTYVSVGPDPATVAPLIVQAIADDPAISKYVVGFARADGTIQLQPKDGRSALALTVAGTTGPSLSNPTLVYNTTALGTIVAVDVVNDPKTITLAVAVTADLVEGQTIGTQVREIVGPHIGDLDMTDQQRVHLAILTESSGVRIPLLPHFDEELRTLFTNIRFDTEI